MTGLPEKTEHLKSSKPSMMEFLLRTGTAKALIKEVEKVLNPQPPARSWTNPLEQVPLFNTPQRAASSVPLFVNYDMLGPRWTQEEIMTSFQQISYQSFIQEQSLTYTLETVHHNQNVFETHSALFGVEPQFRYENRLQPWNYPANVAIMPIPIFLVSWAPGPMRLIHSHTPPQNLVYTAAQEAFDIQSQASIQEIPKDAWNIQNYALSGLNISKTQRNTQDSGDRLKIPFSESTKQSSTQTVEEKTKNPEGHLCVKSQGSNEETLKKDNVSGFMTSWPSTSSIDAQTATVMSISCPEFLGLRVPEQRIRPLPADSLFNVSKGPLSEIDRQNILAPDTPYEPPGSSVREYFDYSTVERPKTPSHDIKHDIQKPSAFTRPPPGFHTNPLRNQEKQKHAADINPDDFYDTGAKHCSFCQNNSMRPEDYLDHNLRMANKWGKVVLTCPILRKHICEKCGATGDDAHTLTHCPVLIKELGRKPKSVANALKNTLRDAAGRMRRKI